MGNEQTKRKIRIEPDGTIVLIYFDELVSLDLPIKTIRRASHVEPNANNEWEADMRPSDGPILGPFTTREAALIAEVAWIEDVFMKREKV